MLTRYRLKLNIRSAYSPDPSWSYQLYSALLNELPPDSADYMHRGKINPLSQHLEREDGEIYWCIGLLGEENEQAIAPTLDRLTALELHNRHAEVSITDRCVSRLSSVEELFRLSEQAGSSHALEFVTPTAFKRRGKYIILPETGLIMQNLAMQWNACVTECPIEDTDGSGIQSLADGLLVTGYRLRSSSFRLKQQNIPGFTGEITLCNRLNGFHRTLANALLLFAEFSGVGTKTSLGMGGIRHLAATTKTEKERIL